MIGVSDIRLMKVVDHEPGAWFLFQEGDDYFLDVNCDRRLVSFSVSIKLTESELEHYAGGGRAYIDDLATQILYRSDPCDPRDLRDPVIRDQIHRSVMTWRENH